MYKQTISDLSNSDNMDEFIDEASIETILNTPQATLAHSQWELSKYTTQELKDELARREAVKNTHLKPGRVISVGSHYKCNIDVTNPEHWYCPEHDNEGSY